MKKQWFKVSLAVLTLVLLIFTLAACDGTVENLKLTFVVDGESYSEIDTSGNEAITIPTDPAKRGYEFDGWYWDKDTWQEPFTANSLLNAPISSNMSVYAKFNKINYSITYISDGGTHSNAASYTVEDAVTLSPAEKSGYSFTAWRDAEGNIKTEIPKGTTGDITLYAEYSPIVYSITYENTKGASNPNPATYTVESDSIVLLPIQKLGYTFLGWYDGDSPVTAIPAGSIGNRELTAAWRINGYALNYHNLADAENTNPEVYNVEELPLTLVAPTRTGYRFLGWYTEAEFENEISELAVGTVGELDLYAKWEIIEYTATFRDGDEIIDTVKFTVEDESIIEPNVPTKMGYTSAWDNYALAANDITVNAVHTPIVYTITYVNGGTHTNAATYTVEDEDIVFTPATKNGYTFVNWTENGTPVTKIAAGSYGDKTITAEWSLNRYSITYVNGGTHTNVGTYTVEDADIVFTPATKNGYTFVEWRENGEAVTGIPTGSYGDKTITAEWKLNTYTITYVNGGTHTNVGTYTIEDADIVFTPATKNGYTFVNWTENGAPVTKIAAGSYGDKTIVANWELIVYNITYMYDDNIGFFDGVTPKTTYTIEDEFDFAELTSYTIGYKLKGWYTEKNNGTGVNVTGIKRGTIGDQTVYAQWELQIFTITYHNVNGATNTNPASYSYESEDISISPLSRVGYTFDGWYTDSECTEAASTLIPSGSVGNLDLYAKWTPVEYKITYILGGGALPEGKTNPEKYTIEDRIASFASPTLEGYSFSGWWTLAEGGERVTGISEGSTGNVTLYAHWSYISTISFDTNGGSDVAPISGTAGTPASAPSEAPEKAHYTFAGWYSDPECKTAYTFSVMPREDITVYAKWIPVSYKITYVLNGGTNNSQNVTSYTVEDAVSFYAPAKTGHSFIAWFTDEALTSAAVTGLAAGNSGDITLYAGFSVNKYTVSFETNGGTTLEEIEQNYGTKLTKPADPSKNGYKFAGWYSDSALKTPYSFTTVPAENITVYAKWTLVNYEIKYNLNGGDNSAANKLSYNITSPDITLYPATKTGYDFVGWYSDPEFNNEVTKIMSGSYGERELYARFALKSYSISYVTPDGTVNGNIDSYTVETDITTLQAPALKGHSFGGWYTDEGFTSSVTTVGGGEIGDKTFYARFTANQYNVYLDGTEGASYTVSFNLNGAEGEIPSQTVTETSALIYPAIPVREGCLFAGWYTSPECEGTAYDFTELITRDIELYAKWLESDNSAIAVGSETAVTVNGTENKIFVFTPLVSGNVTITTIGSLDTYGAIYDANGVMLAQDDDNGDGDNFLIVKNLTAGKLYTVYVRSYSTSVSGEVTLKLSGTATPASGGTAAVSTRDTVTYGEAFTVNVPAAREGYKFLGYSDEDGTMYTDASGASIKAWDFDCDTVLYSVWEKTVYTVTFNTGSGTPIDPVTLGYGEHLNLDDYVTQREGYWVEAWMLDGAPFTGTTMPDRNITLIAKWMDFTLEAIKYNTEKNEISVNDEITPELFGANCLTSNGLTASIRVRQIIGTVGAGETITVILEASYTGADTVLARIENIKVYGMPSLTFDESVDYVNIPNGITASHFSASGTDTYGAAAEILVYIDGEYKAGDTVKIVIEARDAAGNITYGYIENVKVYGAPVINYNEEKTAVSVNDTIDAALFSATAADSFGEALTVTASRYSGTFTAGNTITVRFTVTDSKGNTSTFDKQYKVYGMPTITDVSVTDFKSTDSITPEALGATASDSYGEPLDITLSVKSGTQTKGTVMVLTASVTDPAGNVTVRDFSVKIYGTPDISYSKDALKITEDPTFISYTVSFDMNGGSGNIASQTVTSEIGLVYPEIPTRSGYVFAGWYNDSSFTTPFDFSAPVSRDITVYAKWISYSGNGIIDYNGSKTLSVLPKNSSTEYYAFVPLVSGNITIYSSGGLSDTYGYLYNAAKSQLSSDDDEGDGNNFKISYNVSAGTLYYIRPCGYSASGTTTVYISGGTPASGGKVVSVPNYLNAAATDSFGEALEFEITLKSGTFAGGECVVYTITATDKLGNTATLDTAPIPVYDAADITLSYNPYKEPFIKLTSRGEEFLFSATDSFGEACTLTVEAASGTLTAGTVADIYLVATDAAGNTARSILITEIDVYGMPTIEYLGENEFLSEEKYNEGIENLFWVEDSFFNGLSVSVTESGTWQDGCGITATVTARDRAGNVLEYTYTFHCGTAHVYTDALTAPTCTEKGYTTHTCTCGHSYIDTYTSALGHIHADDDMGTVTAPTCTEQGFTTYSCTRCNESYKANYTAVIPHNYVGGFCTVCGEKQPPAYTRVDKNGNKDENGDYILFGTYPQSEVTESLLKASLDSLSGSLPTSSNSHAWTSYGYYIEGSVSNFMWYIDVEYGGEEYRGVYFSSYRPYYTTNSSSSGNSNQDENGYTTSTVYWFKYEPIKWRILTEENGKALLLCEMLIDSQEYYHSTSSHTVNGSTVYANNYEYSNIRAWLNETFYNTAFNDLQKQIIQLTTVDNSASSTTDTGNNITQATTYACKNTNDYIFLLSEKEVTNSAYGFASYSTYDEARQKKTTDYAQCQGAYTSTSSGYEGNGWWWVRSPLYGSSRAREVISGGSAAGNCLVHYTIGGVCPALWILL